MYVGKKGDHSISTQELLLVRGNSSIYDIQCSFSVYGVRSPHVRYFHFFGYVPNERMNFGSVIHAPRMDTSKFASPILRYAMEIFTESRRIRCAT